MFKANGAVQKSLFFWLGALEKDAEGLDIYNADLPPHGTVLWLPFPITWGAPPHFVESFSIRWISTSHCRQCVPHLCSFAKPDHFFTEFGDVMGCSAVDS